MKIDVEIDIDTKFAISDSGYTKTMNLTEVEQWAKGKMKNIQVLIKEGNLEPRPVPATFKIKHIIFEPGEDS